MAKTANQHGIDQTELPEEDRQEQPEAPSQETPPQDDVPVLALINNQQELFNLERARRRETKRRFKMLGAFVQEDFDKKRLRAFAQARYVSEKTLTSWKHSYLLHGLDGLLPQDWTYLKGKARRIVVERLQALGELTEAITITAEDVYQLVEKHGWHFRKAERMVRRYQIDGVWGLAPERDPERLHRPKNSIPPVEFAAATPKARAEAEKRLALIKPYIGKRHIPNDELKTFAERHGNSLRTMRDYLAKFKKWGLAGLLPKEERADKGHPHNMSLLMEDIIAALRFSQMDIPLHKIHSQARQRALMLGEPEPTLWQVRYVCNRIPEEEKLVADKRFGQFRNERRLTYRFQFDGSVIIYQIDFTKVDVLVRDIRRRGYRTRSKEIRPYLITCIECSSRLILGWLLTYDVPDSNDIAAVIREALVVTDEKPYGGIPHAIWVDQGSQLVSHHVQRIARDLNFTLKDGKPNHPEDRGDPQERGEEERFFGTLKTGLWSTLEGYVHSTPKERNPNAKAKLTITELAQELQTFSTPTIIKFTVRPR
jgi:transposase InsO family protein